MVVDVVLALMDNWMYSVYDAVELPSILNRPHIFNKKVLINLIYERFKEIPLPGP